MKLSNFFVIIVISGSLSVFSQTTIIKDFNNDNYIDTLKLDYFRGPKSIPTYFQFISGINSHNLYFELFDFVRFKLSDYFLVFDDNSTLVNDNMLIESIFKEIYNDSNLNMVESSDNCLYREINSFPFEKDYFDISDENIYIAKFIKNNCFRYYPILPKLSRKLLLFESTKKLWENHLCCDYLGEFDSFYERKGKAIVFFWGYELDVNDFSEFKLNDTISYFDNSGLSFLKNGSQFTWIHIDPRPEFWMNDNKNSFKPKVLLFQNHLIIKVYSQTGEYLELFNITNGSNASLDIKDFKDFSIINENELEVTKHYGDPEIFKLPELFSGF